MRRTVLWVMLGIFLGVVTTGNSWGMVYGTDKRLDFFELRDPAMIELTRAVFTFIPKQGLALRADGKYEFRSSKRLTDLIPLCPEVPFRGQSSPGTFCTGFLVSPTVAVTAGHCVAATGADRFCEDNNVLFDYRLGAAGEVTNIFEPQSVVSCKRVLSTSVGEHDFAVIELSQPATGRKPLAMSDSGHPKAGQELIEVGYPMGLPLKISPGTAVGSGNAESFSTELDTFRGNSGGPILNARTLEVEGIAVLYAGFVPSDPRDPVSGDYQYNSQRSCFETFVCDARNGCHATVDATSVDGIPWRQAPRCAARPRLLPTASQIPTAADR